MPRGAVTLSSTWDSEELVSLGVWDSFFPPLNEPLETAFRRTEELLRIVSLLSLISPEAPFLMIRK